MGFADSKKNTEYHQTDPSLTTKRTAAAHLTHCRMFHLNADSSRSLAKCQDRVVLGSVQPVNSQFGAGGPFHHGNIIIPPGKPEGGNKSLRLTNSVSTACRKCPGGYF